jgi:hypothetical protein
MRSSTNAFSEDPMTNPDLRNQLAALHSELARTSSVDPQSRELLVNLLGDITRLLGSTSATPQTDDDDRPLDERLETLAVQFEAEHPSLGTAIRRVVDALGKAGI